MPKQITYTCTEHIIATESTSSPKKCDFQCTNKLYMQMHMSNDHKIHEPTSRKNAKPRPSRAKHPLANTTDPLTLLQAQGGHICEICHESFMTFKILDKHTEQMHAMFMCRYDPHSSKLFCGTKTYTVHLEKSPDSD